MNILEFEALAFESKMKHLERYDQGARRRYNALMHKYRGNQHHMTCIKAEYVGLREQKARMIKRGCIPDDVLSFLERYHKFISEKKPA